MIQLWLATPATLERHWADLSSDLGLVVLQPGDPQGRRQGDEVVSLQRLCLKLLREAGISVGTLFERAQIDEVIRAALRDERCSSIAEYQGVLRRPGMVRRLSDRLKRTAAQDYADPEALPWFADISLETLRAVYREYLAAAGGIDVPGLFLRFLAESQAPRLQGAIDRWHEKLSDRFGSRYALVIPAADRLLEDDLKFERAISMLLFDRFPEVHLGAHVWPDDDPARVQNLAEGWMAVGAGLQPIEPAQDVPECWFCDTNEKPAREALIDTKRLRFVKTRDDQAEIALITEHVSGLIEGGIPPGEIEIRTPLQGTFVDHLRESLERAGVTVVPPMSRVIDSPQVRTVLDMAEAIAADWPTEALADVLRHPSFRKEAFAVEVTELDIARMALAIERLGNVNGIELIRRMLLVRLDEDAARRRDTQADFGHALMAVEALTNLETALAAPAQEGDWESRVSELVSYLQALFDENFLAETAVRNLLECLENGVGAALSGDRSPWSWTDFLREAQLRAESRFLTPAGSESAAVKIGVGESDAALPVRHLVLAGMTEGHYPSRAKIRDALMRSDEVDLQALYASQMRRFREAVGAASETLWISWHSRNEQGIETEPCGFLRQVPWESIKPVARIPAEFEPDPEILHAVEAASLRIRSRGGPFDGELMSPLASNALANRFGPDFTFSASSLEAFSLCPFRFFGNYVLGLGGEEIDDDLATDYRAEGEAIHAVLEDLHRSMPVAGIVALSDDAIHAKLEQLVAQRHPCPPRLASSDLGRARWEVQNLRIVTKLSAYSRQIRRDLEPPSARARGKSNAATLFDGDFEVLQCELRSGSDRGGLERLTIDADAGGVRFRIGGRIDRIDGVPRGDVRGVRLIDYKTGSQITENDVKARLHLQLPIYAMMVHQSRFGAVEYHVEDLGFWYLKGATGGYRSIREWVSPGAPLDIEILRIELEPFLRTLVADLRAGRFPVRPRVFGCEDRCDLAELCRIRERRARKRTPEKGSDPFIAVES
ncbi:hypothetical protein GC170_16305 [bacterium]|nr:hypothetical protein [bacterium]